MGRILRFVRGEVFSGGDDGPANRVKTSNAQRALASRNDLMFAYDAIASRNVHLDI
jgi:tagatose-1,6-bisphosphate aldolase non-catalytic subunit AgaZ/GatZ